MGRREPEIEMQKPKHVLMLRSNPVDPDPRVEKEADALLESGYPVDVFCWDRGSSHAVERSVKKTDHGEFTLYRAGIPAAFSAGFRKNLKPLLKFQFAILKYLKAKRKDYSVVHACDFDTALAGFIGYSRKTCKFVYDIFDYYADAFSVPQALKKIVIALDTFVINHSDAVLICSEKRREQLGNAAPKRLAVIHNSPSLYKGAGKDRSKKKRDKYRIAYIGILSDGRMIPELLEIVSRHKDYELHIAGFGKFETLVREYAERCDNITFFGRTEYSQTLEIESESDIMLAIYDPAVPNHSYAAPNKFYEALMLGKPLVMCRGTGFSDLVEEQNFGVCIDYTEESLEEGLNKIVEGFDKYDAQGEFEKAIFMKDYSWDKMAERLAELYSALMDEL